MMKSGNGWPKAIFYDSKNTLFDWSKVWVEASTRIVDKYGSKVSGEEFKNLWHHLLVSENHRTAFSHYRDFSEALKDSLVYTLRYFGIPGNAGDLEYMLNGWREVRPFPDTVPALREQQKMTKVLIFSNVETRYLTMMVEKMDGFMPDFVGTMEQAQTCKPSPRAYYWVLEKNKLGLDDVVYCARPQWDVQGAYALGMKSIWLNRVGEELGGAKPDWEVKDLHGVTEIVRDHLLRRA
ncbi:MAG: HAD hydrolase-like protein [Thermodesulfobacteriota bacterium]